MVLALSTETIAVGLGDVCVTDDAAKSLAAYGLGSCIGVCVYDPIAKVGGIAHVVLPVSNPSAPGPPSTKYADVAVPALLQQILKLGSSKRRLTVKLIGGARMIQAAGFDDTIEMGARNLEMVKKALAAEGLTIAATETGGHQGRSVWLHMDSCRVMVRVAGCEPWEL